MNDIAIVEDKKRQRDVLRPLIAGQKVASGTEERRPPVLEIRDEEPAVRAEAKEEDLGELAGALSLPADRIQEPPVLAEDLDDALPGFVDVDPVPAVDRELSGLEDRPGPRFLGAEGHLLIEPDGFAGIERLRRIM